MKGWEKVKVQRQNNQVRMRAKSKANISITKERKRREGKGRERRAGRAAQGWQGRVSCIVHCTARKFNMTNTEKCPADIASRWLMVCSRRTTADVQ